MEAGRGGRGKGEGFWRIEWEDGENKGRVIGRIKEVGV